MRDYVAIFDIGSNAVRLVVYDALSPAPVKIHNERSLCGLGASLSATGRLDPDGVRQALASLGRFSGLVSAMKIRHVFAVATAAVRDAEDGAGFIRRIRNDFGLDVAVIGGREEARLSALGVLSNGLGRNGIIGDYGGGSLELIALEGGRVKHSASLPLGSLRLHPLQGRAARVKEIDTQLETAEFLKEYAGRDFTALGGAWRSMGKAHMHLKNHPLRVLDHYEIAGPGATDFAALLSRQSPASLEKAVGLSKRRVRDVAAGALVMERLFEILRPGRLVFSGTGLREGLLYDQLSPAQKKQDPLIAGCVKFAESWSRFNDVEALRALSRFVSPLVARESAELKRLMEASCLLSDSSGFEHEDYQAEHACRRVFVLPFYAVGHPGRAFLALSQYVRYKGYLRRARRGDDDVTAAAQKILDENAIDRAIVAGLAQRLGYLLTGGALKLLKHAELKVAPKRLTLVLKAGTDTLNAGVIEGALKDLAKAMGREAEIK